MDWKLGQHCIVTAVCFHLVMLHLQRKEATEVLNGSATSKWENFYIGGRDHEPFVAVLYGLGL